jgi:hypothetical protein
MRIIKIGKASSNDIVINGDTTVSRVHMQMFIDDEANVFVTDLNSMNGTFVNGIKISESVKLNTYDILLIGNSLINWKEYLLDDVDAQDAYKTIVDENKQDLLDSLDDINDLYNGDEQNTNDPNRRKKKKKYIWYAIAASIVIGGAYMYFNTDSQLILNEWTSKNNSELSYTFNDDGTFLKDSAGIIKKGTFVLIDGRKKKLELSFNDESLPVFLKTLTFRNLDKFSFPKNEESKRYLDELYGNTFLLKNNYRKSISIKSLIQETYIENEINVSSKVLISKESYLEFSTESNEYDKWNYSRPREWKSVSDITSVVVDRYISHEINPVIIEPSELISFIVLTNIPISQTKTTEFDEGSPGIEMTTGNKAQTFNNNFYYSKDIFGWNGKIVYGLMQADFDYSYEFIDGYLEINGELFKNN